MILPVIVQYVKTSILTIMARFIMTFTANFNRISILVVHHLHTDHEERWFIQ